MIRQRRITVYPPGLLDVRVYAPAAAAAAAWYVVPGKTCVAAYQPKGAASQAASYVNLANPGTYDAAPGTAPSWAAGTGWTFELALSTYLETGVIPQSGWSAACQFADAADEPFDRALFGCRSAGASTFFTVFYRGNGSLGYDGVLYGNGAYIGVVPGLLSGNLAIAGNTAYRNGLAEGAAIGAWGGVGNRAIRLGVFLNDSGNYGYGNFTMRAFAVHSDTLTAGEMATLYTAMAAL